MWFGDHCKLDGISSANDTWGGRECGQLVKCQCLWVERCQVATDPQTKPNFLGCESACGLPESTPTITIYHYYSAQKVILILLPHEG